MGGGVEKGGAGELGFEEETEGGVGDRKKEGACREITFVLSLIGFFYVCLCCVKEITFLEISGRDNIFFWKNFHKLLLPSSYL